MVEYIVKDRSTDEVLCRGTSKECAEHIGCDVKYLRDLATRKQPKYKVESKYSKYKVERHGEVKHGGARMKDITCCDCGVLMKNVGSTRKRCPECAKKHTRTMNKLYMREVRNPKPAIPEISKTEEKAGCEGCIYFGGYYPASRCCNYIFIMGEKRPCPPGKDCTVREEKAHG